MFIDHGFNASYILKVTLIHWFALFKFFESEIGECVDFIPVVTG
jgi:hypothetical protein